MQTSDVKTMFRLGGKFIPVGTKVAGAAYVGQPGKVFSFDASDSPAVYSFLVRNSIGGRRFGEWHVYENYFKPDATDPLDLVSGGDGNDCEGVALPANPSRVLALYEFESTNDTDTCYVHTGSGDPDNGDVSMILRPGQAIQTWVYDVTKNQVIKIDKMGGSLKVSVITLGIL